MKEPISFVKVAVVASSVILASGFIAYRAGAFDWMNKSGPPPIEQVQDDPSDAAAQPAPAPALTLMSGSKSTWTFIGSDLEGSQHGLGTFTVVPMPDGTPKQPTLMSGSKSLGVAIPPSSVTTVPQTDKPKAIMFGSKSAPAFIPPSPEPQQQQPTKP